MTLNNFQNPMESSKSYQKLIQWYSSETKNLKIIVICFGFFLILSSFGQFAIIEYSLSETFDLSSSDRIFGISIKTLLSLLVTAALPIITFIDEWEILGEKLKISVGEISFSPVNYCIFPGDIFITFLAVLSASNELVSSNFMIPTMAFLLAAIFSTSALCLTKAIVSRLKKIERTKEKLIILEAYGVDPDPLYKNAEQIRLADATKLAQEKALKAEEKLKQEQEQYQTNLNEQKLQYESKLRSQKEEDGRQLQKLENKLVRYKEQIDSVSILQKKFSQIKKPILEVITQGKSLFEKFSNLDSPVKELVFPQLNFDSEVDDKVVEKLIYRWAFSNSDDSWEDLQIPFELSPPGFVLLQVIQQQKLPRPTLRLYAPRESLSKCLVLDFDAYDVVVYCRDDKLQEDVEQWTQKDELSFQYRLNEQQTHENAYTLVFTPNEIMGNPSEVVEPIRDAIYSRMNGEFN
jgi:hypothetical protein